MGPPRSLLYVMPYGIMGVLLGWLWRRGKGWGWSILLGTILGTVGLFFRIWLVSLLLGDDLWLYLSNQITGFLEWILVWLNWLVRPSVLAVQLSVVGLVIFNNAIYLVAVNLVSWILFDHLEQPIPAPPRWLRVILDADD